MVLRLLTTTGLIRIGLDYGRLYVAMAEKFLGSGDTVASSSGCGTEKWPLRFIFPRTSSMGFSTGVWGEAEAILMRTDIRALASGAEGISAVAGASSEQPGIAEAVEKVGATRIFVTMIHDSGHLRNFDSMASFALNHCFKKFGTGDFFNSLSQEATFRVLPH